MNTYSHKEYRKRYKKSEANRRRRRDGDPVGAAVCIGISFVGAGIMLAVMAMHAL